ncbi:helix-turn-helix domain-containing protein [Pseudonocardia sp. C8]|uniref:PucR family transcriptional regulator n=1 Tax=Pseudonocardia sp. C8 TaxID=2762759 RepID=UPI001642633A|nr:helix-turn-helix domain-containing protein [Pseudonocardia sp. C8]MBC3191758.1 helix-turn-helix domain-containing protein [Pseudonocardia sp. C8]
MRTVDLTPLAHALARHGPELVDDMVAMLLVQITELQDGDEQVVGRLRASIESNVSAIQHLWEQPVDVRLVDPPAGALQWALQLAQRGIPLSVLWRAYHLCTARVLEFSIEELAGDSGSTDELARRMTTASTLLNAYVDHICERVASSYEVERQRWLRQQDAVRAERIEDLLAGRVGDRTQVEAALGYRLTGRHLGVIVWDGASPDGSGLLQLQRLVGRYAGLLGCHEPPLVVARDQATVWAWLTLPPGRHGNGADVLNPLLVDAGTTLRGAVGDPAPGIDGFARTHRRAATAQSVALAAGGGAATVTPYASVAGVSFVCQDLDRAREWVREELGDLAVDDEAHGRLRESIIAFLDTGGSLNAAAERLGCHKNTVQYRIRRAEQMLGHSIRERRVDLELALQTCHWLGAAVLYPPPTT